MQSNSFVAQVTKNVMLNIAEVHHGNSPFLPDDSFALYLAGHISINGNS